MARKLGCMEFCGKYIRWIFFFFTLLFWVIGILTMGIGIWAAADHSFDEVVKVPGIDSNDVGRAAILLVVIGVIVMVTGFLGCFGAVKNSKCFLVMFSIMLSFILVFMIFSATLVGAFKSDLQREFETGISKLKEQHQVNETKGLLEVLQQEFRCCEFQDGKVANVTVKSCFGSSDGNSTQPVLYKQNCTFAVKKLFAEYQGPIVGIAAVNAGIMLLGIIVSTSLCCHIMRKNPDSYQTVR